MTAHTTEDFARMSGFWTIRLSWVAYAARSGYEVNVNLLLVRDLIVSKGTVKLVTFAAAMLDGELEAALAVAINSRSSEEEFDVRREGLSWLNRLQKLLEAGTGPTFRPGDWSDSAVFAAREAEDSCTPDWESELLKGN